MKKETDINIDALLRDTFLTVVELRQGTTVRHGMELYRHCQRQVELVRERLKDAGFSRESVEHITYAQCALLDETVLSRSGMDDGQAIWMKDPLQSHFFNTLQAGELLYERMKQVLQEPAPAQAVLTCFHRVLLLGFRGRYQDPVAPERDQLISTLNGLVAPFGVLPETAVLNVPLTGFEIDVVLNENWPHDLPFDSDNIRLHCVPVINLFPLEADPLHLSPLENEFLLRPMRIQDGHTEIYSVDNIISSRHTGSQAYVPFSSFRHRGGMLRHDAPERYYHTRVKRGPSGLHDTWLILGGDAFDADRMLEDETLSLSLTGTNGHLPRKALQSTLLDRPVHASQNVLRVRNLCAPTQPCYPPARDRFHWRVLSHLGSNFLSMMDNAEILRGTLALYDWTESEMNRRRLEAIVDVQHSLIQRFERGFLLRGVDIQVTLDSNGFAGEGDITLFGELLHRFFALYADIHLFTQLTLILQPTGKCLQWTEHHSQRVPG
ncbi:TPA: type VI secretion system baseplate subunit TssF [Escherichia coli]|nr:type VI secretion system baseplate subunit TssF [Escherichia coli]HBQ4412437.1 type VI secretion system protein TssL, short form [Escherichia coli]